VVLPLSLIPVAQQWISSSLTGMLGGVMPIFAAVISSILLRSAPRRRQVVGIALGFVGTVMVGSSSLGDRSNAILGVALVVTATACYGLAVNLAAPLQQKYGSPTVMARCLIVGSIVTAPLAWLTRGDSVFEPSAFMAIVVCGVFSTGLANAAFGVLIGRAGSARASIVAYLVPVVAVVLGTVVANDPVSVVALIGVATILVGAWLASRAEI
jgi:drug/metabolite transporter (DMT)-like permease